MPLTRLCRPPVALGVGRLAQLEDLKAGVEDRAYRLHYNQGQNRADLFAQAISWYLNCLAAVAGQEVLRPLLLLLLCGMRPFTRCSTAGSQCQCCK